MISDSSESQKTLDFGETAKGLGKFTRVGYGHFVIFTLLSAPLFAQKETLTTFVFKK